MLPTCSNRLLIRHAARPNGRVSNAPRAVQYLDEMEEGVAAYNATLGACRFPPPPAACARSGAWLFAAGACGHSRTAGRATNPSLGAKAML